MLRLRPGLPPKSLKGKPPVGVRAKNAKGIESMRRRGQVCNNGARWQLCARVSCLLALACVHTRVRVCVCLVNCALTTCLVKASFFFFRRFRNKPLWKRKTVLVARNEVENASFAQRSAHRDSRIWRPELIEPAAERNRRVRRRRPTLKSAYPDPQILPQCNISSNYPL